MLGRHDLVTFLQRAMGYSLTGNISERVTFILHGGGRNGKTTLLETMNGILGDYAGTAPAEMLLARRGDAGIPNDLARLPGTRFVSATETGDGRRLDEVKIKSITGGDTISARFMREEWFDFKPTFKIWLATNHKPEIRGTDNAIWDRIRLVPFDYRVPDDQKIPDLSATFIAEEAPGILAWMVQGCLDWQRDGLTMPGDVLQATARYRHDMDPLADWTEDRCEIRPGVREAAKTLFADYVSYCESAGEEPLKQRTFGMRLTERGCGEAKSGATRYRTGIRLRDSNDPAQTTFEPGDTSHDDTAHPNTSHEKAYESGGFQDSGDARDVTDVSFGMNTREKRFRVHTETNVPYVPNVPNDDPAEPLEPTGTNAQMHNSTDEDITVDGVAGDDRHTR
jgi:putative DNA primase/helicase